MLGPCLSLVIMLAAGNARIRASGVKKKASRSPLPGNICFRKRLERGKLAWSLYLEYCLASESLMATSWWPWVNYLAGLCHLHIV